MTKIGAKRVRTVRCRGGNKKQRALRLDTGNFCWGTENCSRKTRIMNVVYNASNMELVRTNTLTKSTIVQVDATPFKQWYLRHYGVDLSKKKGTKGKTEKEEEAMKASGHVQAKLKHRAARQKIDTKVEDQFPQGRILAVVSSRPGQSS